MVTQVLIIHGLLPFAITLKQTLERGAPFEAHPFTSVEAAAEYLRDHPQVTWIKYPALADSPEKPLVDKYMGGRGSSILSFGIKSGREAGAKFIDALQLVTRLVNIGDAKSLACHPATTTHRQLSPEELAKAGVSEDLVRLSIGIEHIDDILADLEQALAAAK